MRQAAAKKVTRPENCVLGFGIPTSEADYLASRELGGPRFAKNFSSPTGRLRYLDEVIRPYRRVVPGMERLGVRVLRRLTLSDFGAQFEDRGIHAVVLFSHWGRAGDAGDAVEFHDGFAPTRKIVDRVPRQTDKVIDLCVCHPDSLGRELEATRPRSTVRLNPGGDGDRGGLTPDLWLGFYAQLFRHLHGSSTGYVEAHKRLILAALEKATSLEEIPS